MTELLILRLALVAVLFVVVFAAASMMRGGVRSGRGVRLNPPVRSGYSGARLVLVMPADTGLALGTEVAIAGETLIGRDGASGVVLPDPSVSGRHATIYRDNGAWKIRDLGSTNGTVVDGRVVRKGSVALRGGEEISIGAVRLRFQA